jgi:hypothetical protein
MMGNLKTRGRLEELAVSKLAAHGWTIVGGDRRGLDLNLFVQFEGISGKVSFRNALDLPQGLAENADSDPCSVWIELGEPIGEPTRWSLWDEYDFRDQIKSQRFIATIVHEAIGKGWAKVAGGDVEPGQTWRSPSNTLETIISRAECLAPSRDEADRRREIWRTQRHNFDAQHKKLNPVTYGVLFFIFLALPVGLFFTEWLRRGEVTTALIGGTVLCSVFLLIFVIHLFVLLIRHVRRPRDPAAGMDAVVNALRVSGAFDAFDSMASKTRHGLPVVVRSQDHLDKGEAPLTVSRVHASSSKHGVTLEADLCEIRWPEGVAPEIRFLPQRWLLVELIGSPEELAQIPSYHRSDRLEDQIRWLFTGEELDGAFENLLRAVSASLVRTAAPYR